jgi:methionyl-tRNA formyltransferase
MSGKKLTVALLVQESPPIVYFTNRLAEQFDVSLVVVERPAPKPRRRPTGWEDLREALWRRRRYKAHAPRRKADYDRWYGDRWQGFEPTELLEVESVNAPAVIDALTRVQPDVVVDHGTTLLREPVIESVPLILNLHWGLSPYYRGVTCTDWALARWDPYSIGVTIHKISKRIDGGDIVVQGRANVEAHDTAHSINCQLTALGTDLVARSLARLQDHGGLRFHEQDLTQGFLSLTKNWSPWLARHIAWIEDNGIVEQMLRRPSRPPAEPIVETVEAPAAP